MKYLQKYASIILLSFLIALIVALFFSQGFVALLSTVLVVFAVGTATIFTIYSNWKTKQNDALTNAQFARNTTVDLLGLVLTLFIAMWLGRMAGGYAGETWGMFVGIVAAMAVGFIAAFFVGKLWGKFAEPMKVKAA